MRNAIKAGFRLMGFQLVGALIALLLLVPLSGINWVLILLNIAFLALYGLMLWTDAANRGQAAATLSASLERQRSEGRQIDPNNERDAFHIKDMWIGYAIGVTPFLLLALYNLVSGGDWPQAICRIAFAAYVTIFVYLDANRPMLNALFVLLAFLLPMLMPIGYMQGPRLRKQKLAAIAKGVKKKKRLLPVNQKKKQAPKQPKMEV